jgi:hypothetical protein
MTPRTPLGLAIGRAAQYMTAEALAKLRRLIRAQGATDAEDTA